jgi:hypothetical protein
MIPMRQQVSAIGEKKTHHRQYILQHEGRLGPHHYGTLPIEKLVKRHEH